MDLATLLALIPFSALVLIGANSLVNSFLLGRPSPPAPRPSSPRPPAPDAEIRLSVLIPARDEEANIGACLASLLDQDLSQVEIIVLDDRSQDKTTEIITALGFSTGEGARLRLIHGSPLPDGWAGKPWACHQLSQAARGSYFLFTDADTFHFPGALETALTTATTRRASLLSAWPRQVTQTLGEKLVVSQIFLAGASLTPLAVHALARHAPSLARRIPSGLLAITGVANGQYILFERQAYAAIGGHQSQPNHLVEDVALGRAVAARAPDLQLVNVDGGDLLRCRMYRSWPEVWRGFSKNARPLFEKAELAFWLYGLFFLSVFVLPFFLWPFASGTTRTVLLAHVGGVFALRFFLAFRYRSSLLGAILHPLGAMAAVAIAINSWRWHRMGKLMWKGRSYSS